MFVLLFLLFSTSLEDPIIFETTLTCNKEHIGPNGWCAEGFFVDNDHWGEDEAVHYFLMCSKNDTIYVISDAANPGGDEWGSRYGFRYVIFHNCYFNYYDYLLEDGNVNICICDYTRKLQFTDVDGLQHIRNKMNFSDMSFNLDDKRCLVPPGFKAVTLQSGEHVPKRGCSWKGFEKREIKWSFQHSK